MAKSRDKLPPPNKKVEQSQTFSLFESLYHDDGSIDLICADDVVFGIIDWIGKNLLLIRVQLYLHYDTEKE